MFLRCDGSVTLRAQTVRSAHPSPSAVGSVDCKFLPDTRKRGTDIHNIIECNMCSIVSYRIVWYPVSTAYDGTTKTAKLHRGPANKRNFIA